MKSTKRSKRKPQLMLSDRDQAILNHISLYGMTWFGVLHHRFFENRRRAAAKSTLRRLLGPPGQRRLIYSTPLDSQRVYYRLTLSGCRLLGVSPKQANALGRTSVIRRYAVQWFLCMEGSTQRTYIAAKELNAAFPEVSKNLPQPNFYKAVHSETEKKLGYAVVDYGRDVRRVVNRLIRRLRAFDEQNAFAGLIANQAFEATILTYRDSKRLAIERRLAKHVVKQNEGVVYRTTGGHLIPINVVIVDQMEALIADPRRS